MFFKRPQLSYLTKFSLFILFCIQSSVQNCVGQNEKVETILLKIKKSANDTLKAIEYNNLAKAYGQLGELDSSMKSAVTSLKLCELLLSSSKSKTESLRLKDLLSDAYTSIGIINRMQGNYESSLKAYFKALSIDNETGYKNDIGATLGNIANVYENKGDFPEALDYLNKSLTIAEEVKDTSLIAVNLGNIGNVYLELGNFPEALSYQLRTLRLDEALGNKNDIAADYGNIGNIYQTLSDYDNALKYHLKALKLAREIGNKNYIETFLGDLGNIYMNKASVLQTQSKPTSYNQVTSPELYMRAFEYYSKALEISQEIGNKSGTGRHLAQIAEIHLMQQNYSKSLEFFLSAYAVFAELEEKANCSAILVNISSTYCLLKQYQKSFDFGYEALILSDSLHVKGTCKDAYETLSKLYENATIQLLDTISGKLLSLEQMRLKSLYYYKRSIAIRDTIYSDENKKQLIQKGMAYEFEKKEAILNAKNEKEQALAKEENNKQKTIIIFVALVLLLVLVFAFFIFKSLRVTQKQKNTIEEKSKLIEEKSKLVEEKNKEITDSISYAKRIQNAMITSNEYLKEKLPAEHFVLFKPKDIVSGDFYWALSIPRIPNWDIGTNSIKLLPGIAPQNIFYIITADCTGHGVPGAFMSMLNISLLERNIVDLGIRLPNDILNKQREEIINVLNPAGSKQESRDGMDCVLCAFDFDKMLLHVAAANNSFWIIRDGEITEYSADKMPVGKYSDNPKAFGLQTIALRKGDVIYTATDGYVDQFGTTGKKLMKKRFKEELLKIHNLSMPEQKEYLKSFINNWMGTLEQIDDILVIGIKI